MTDLALFGPLDHAHRAGPQIRRQVTDLIESGQLDPGAALPSLRVLARHWGVKRDTVQHAFAALSEAGTLEVSPAHFRVPADTPGDLVRALAEIGGRIIPVGPFATWQRMHRYTEQIGKHRFRGGRLSMTPQQFAAYIAELEAADDNAE